MENFYRYLAKKLPAHKIIRKRVGGWEIQCGACGHKMSRDGALEDLMPLFCTYCSNIVIMPEKNNDYRKTKEEE
jgi:DNA-directed RNA polymerase subunit RPC12/RpoP